jgi:tetratricopeptide (TPR) repeat protein
MKHHRLLAGIAVTAVILAASACMSEAKRVALQNERDPQYQFNKAALCLQYNMVDEAFKYIDQALALNPRFTAAVNLRGFAFMMKGRIPEAIQTLKACVEIDPTFSEGWNNLGTAYDQNNQKNEAMESWKKAYDIDQNYNASYNLAKASYERSQYDIGLDWIRKSIAKFQKSVLAFNLQGLIYEAMEQYPEAIDSYEAAMKLSPTELNVQFNMATAYYKKRDLPRARDILEKILPQAKDDLKISVQDLLKRIGR